MQSITTSFSWHVLIASTWIQHLTAVDKAQQQHNPQRGQHIGVPQQKVTSQHISHDKRNKRRNDCWHRNTKHCKLIRMAEDVELVNDVRRHQSDQKDENGHPMNNRQNSEHLPTVC